MVSFIVRFKFGPEDRAEIAQSLRLLTEESRKEPGCANYVAHRADDDPDAIVIYEQYQDDKALAAHRESEHFKKYVVGGLLQKMKEMTHEDLVALV